MIVLQENKDDRELTTQSTLELVYDYSVRLASTTDKHQLFSYCVSLAKKALHLDYSTLLLLNNSGKKLVVRATDGLSENMIGIFDPGKGEGLEGYVLLTKNVETVGNFSLENRFNVNGKMTKMGIQSAIAVPMLVSEKVFGVLVGHCKKVRQFKEEEELLFQVLANHAAIAIKNVIHIDSLYRSEIKREKKIRELQREKEVSRERSDEFESIFSNIMTGVILLKGGRYLARCNQKLVEMFGYASADEMFGMSLRKLHLSDENYRDFGRKYYGNLITGGIVQAEYKLMKKDGTPMLCRLSGRSVDQAIPPDLAKGFVWVIDDISGRKEMEEEVLQARKLESIGILAGGIGHDFNNILSAILGNLGLAKRLLEPDHKIQELLSSALEAADKAKDLTAKLLFFTRRNTNRRVGSVKLQELLHEVNFGKFLGKKVELLFDVQPDLLTLKIMPDHLKAILQNLLLNADGCMPKGGRVYLRGHNLEVVKGDVPGLSSGKYVEIVVEDNGSGIRSEILDNIFDPYFTTKNRDSSKGIGLGLAIVHSIVKKNHGHISVRSGREEGTVFTIILPAAINDLLGFKN